MNGSAAVAGAGVKALTCAVQEEAAVAQGLAEHQATLDTELQVRLTLTLTLTPTLNLT